MSREAATGGAGADETRRMPAKHYSLTQLQAGMILAQQILDENGRVIMQEGARLTPMYIHRLGKFGIHSVAIEVAEPAAPAPAEGGGGAQAARSVTAEDREFMRRIAERVQERFADVADNPLMAELKRLAVRHLILAGPGAVPGLK